MSRRDVTITLRQMLDYAQKAVTLSRGRKRSDLDEDLTFNLALTRLIEIIGMRNRLIHGYDEVDFDFLWKVVRNDLPSLIKQLNRIM
jgi:uncharacterized protein with HEPN domain